MKIGAVFPQTEFGNDPIAIKDYAQAIEDMGFDYLLAYDHVLGANPDRPGGWQGPYTHETPFHEPLMLFSYLAGFTKTLEFTTGIIILPQRPTALVAKQAAELDVLSGGRLRLGIGIGWNKVELEGLGYEFHNRGKRIEEQVTLLRELWTKPLVTFKGKYHTIDDAGINPLPLQRPIPIWFGGGTAEPVMRRIARLADGWILNPRPVEDGEDFIPRLHQYLEAAGRSPTNFGLDVRVDIKRHPLHEWANYINSWGALGATHVCLSTMRAGFTKPGEHIDALAQFKTVIGSL